MMIKTSSGAISQSVLIHSFDDYLANLPSDYLYASNPWGDSFYKLYGEMNYTAAEVQCKSDGTFLPVPRFEAENNFIADLSNDSFWIGVNDLQEEGKFVSACVPNT